MRLTSLTLDQFRSYRRAELTFSDTNAQFFVGPNGSGKTNLLEAMGILSFSKSFLHQEEEDLREWGTEFYRVRAEAKSDAGESKTLEVVSQIAPKRQKACFLNDVRINLSRIVGQLPLVVFLPQDLSLFTGPPGDRRRFLDQILCQVSEEYFVSVVEYQRLLKQRNALLKRIASGNARSSELEPWDERVADRAAVITLLRLELTETFGVTLQDEVLALGEVWENIRIEYQRTGEAHDLAGLRGQIRQALSQSVDRDVMLQSTTVGPHRDDWQIKVGEYLLPSFASRGQQRVAVLALLFLQASYLEVRRSERPVILLDDIFSELDSQHRRRVMESFREHQVFLTGTDVPAEAEGIADVWDVRLGEVRRAGVASGV
jgi:DNA replication and repair protein RecF